MFNKMMREEKGMSIIQLIVGLFLVFVIAPLLLSILLHLSEPRIMEDKLNRALDNFEAYVEIDNTIFMENAVKGIVTLGDVNGNKIIDTTNIEIIKNPEDDTNYLCASKNEITYILQSNGIGMKINKNTGAKE